MHSDPRLTAVLAILLGGLLASFAAGALRAGDHAAAGSAGASTASPPLPAFKHIFVIVLENKAYDQVLGSQNASYLNALAHQYGLATSYYGIRHPSLPNYLALTGGDTFGIASNCTDCFVHAPNLVDQLEGAGRSWKAYMEDMPSPCFVGDAPPLYQQKHNPFIYYDSVRNDQARCNKIVPFTQFSLDIQANALPHFVWITPNMCNDGHNCPVSASDGWLKVWVPQILQSAAWKDDGVLFITFDEGEDGDGRCCTYAEGGQIATLVISPLGKPGFTSEVAYDHYSLLRTIETTWGLPLLGKANCACSPIMADFFQVVPRAGSTP
jgi:acid phosphatase